MQRNGYSAIHNFGGTSGNLSRNRLNCDGNHTKWLKMVMGCSHRMKASVDKLRDWTEPSHDAGNIKICVLGLKKQGFRVMSLATIFGHWEAHAWISNLRIARCTAIDGPNCSVTSASMSKCLE